MARRGTVRLLGVVVGFLALVGVGASATHFLQEPYNSGFLRFPTIVALHVVLGGLYLALAPFPGGEADQVPAPRLPPVGREAARRHRSGGRGYGPVYGHGHPLVGLDREDLHRCIRGSVPGGPHQGLRSRPSRKGGAVQGVDDPGVRHRAARGHDAPDLRPGSDHVAAPTDTQIDALSVASFAAFDLHASVVELRIRTTATTCQLSQKPESIPFRGKGP
jgi:hypothetical protein